jgi:hypothetical protein
MQASMSSSQLFAKMRKRSLSSKRLLCQLVTHSTGQVESRLGAISLPSDLTLESERSNIGEATLYGVYFDDTEYDYMQHLRPVGSRDDGFESVLVEAPTRRTTSKTGVYPSPSMIYPQKSFLPPRSFPAILRARQLFRVQYLDCSRTWTPT